MNTDVRLIQSDALQILPTSAQSLRRSADSVAAPSSEKSSPSSFEELLDDRLTSRSDAQQREDREAIQSDQQVDRPDPEDTDPEATDDPDASDGSGDGDERADDTDRPVDADADQKTAHDDAGTQDGLGAVERPVQSDAPAEQSVIVDRPASKGVRANAEQSKPTAQNAQSAPKVDAEHQTKTAAPSVSESLSGLGKKSELARQQIQSAAEPTAVKEQLSEPIRVQREPTADEAQTARVVKHEQANEQVGAFREQLRDRVLGADQDGAEAKQPTHGRSARETQAPTDQGPKHAQGQDTQPIVQNTATSGASSASAIVGAAPVPSAIQSVLDRINGVRAMMPGASSVQGASGQPNPASVTAVSSAGGASIGSDGSNAPKLGVLKAQSSHTDRAAVIAQVQRGLASMLRSGGGEMTLRLRPDHLGELKIRMHTEDGGVRASFETRSDGAREAIERGLVRLREQLESKGIRVDELRVDQREQDALSDRQSASDDRQSDSGSHSAPSTDLGGDSSEHEQQNESQHDEPRGIWTELGLDAVA